MNLIILSGDIELNPGFDELKRTLIEEIRGSEERVNKNIGSIKTELKLIKDEVHDLRKDADSDDNTSLGGSEILEELVDATTKPLSQSAAEAVCRSCNLSQSNREWIRCWRTQSSLPRRMMMSWDPNH